MKDSNNRLGQRFTGRVFGSAAIRRAIEEMLNCFYSPTISVKTRAPDGTQTLSTTAAVTMGPLGWVADIDLTQAGVGTAGGTKQFKIVSDGGDYWNCHEFDGSTEGATIFKVAKPQELRCLTGRITNEIIRGITYTYTYTAVTVSGTITEYTRAATGSDGSSETDYVTPPMLPGRIITADAFTTLAPSSLTDALWIYKGPPAWGE